MKDISIRKNIQKWYEDVEMPGGYTFNYPDTLKRIDAYYNGKFLSGDYDDQGQRKIFYNISKSPVDVAAKFVDLDTKHIIFTPEISGIEYSLLLMQKRFKNWMKEKKMGQLLNRLSFRFPKYGHIVVKKTNEINHVNLMNLRMDPSVNWLEESPFVYEIHSMTPDQIKERNWKGEDLEAVLEMDKDQYIVYECYHRDEEKWKRIFKTGLFELKQENSALTTPESLYASKKDKEYFPSMTLHEDEVSKLPYKEVKWEEVDGRHLGLGFVEMLFDDQIRMNEIQYLKGKALYLKAMQIFYSRDENIGDNLITDRDFGDVLTTTSDLVQVQRDNQDLVAYNQEEERWDTSIRKKTHNTDIAMGDQLPAQTPLGLGQLQAKMTISYFDVKRENFGMFIKDLLFEHILPEFKKKNKEEHYLAIPKSDEHYETLLNETVEARLSKAVEDMVKEGVVPSWEKITELRQTIEDRLRQKKSLDFMMNKDFYNNLKENIEIVITDESVDINTKNSILQFALSTMSSNPQILENPATRNMFFKILEMMGTNPAELGLLSENFERAMAQGQQMPQGQGGAQTPQAPQLQGASQQVL